MDDPEIFPNRSFIQILPKFFKEKYFDRKLSAFMNAIQLIFSGLALNIKTEYPRLSRVISCIVLILCMVTLLYRSYINRESVKKNRNMVIFSLLVLTSVFILAATDGLAWTLFNILTMILVISSVIFLNLLLVYRSLKYSPNEDKHYIPF